jgi:hypothetical protein
VRKRHFRALTFVIFTKRDPVISTISASTAAAFRAKAPIALDSLPRDLQQFFCADWIFLKRVRTSGTAIAYGRVGHSWMNGSQGRPRLANQLAVSQ